MDLNWEEEVIGGCRMLHFEELYSLYPSSNIVTMMISRSVIWAGYAKHVKKIRSRRVKRRNLYRILVENPEGEEIVWFKVESELGNDLPHLTKRKRLLWKHGRQWEEFLGGRVLLYDVVSS
jgi:hypothetical protein